MTEHTEPDPTPITILERGLTETLANLPVGGSVPEGVAPEHAFVHMHDDDPIYLLGGLQRIAWAAVYYRNEHDAAASRYHRELREVSA